MNSNNQLLQELDEAISVLVKRITVTKHSDNLVELTSSIAKLIYARDILLYPMLNGRELETINAL